MPDRVIAVQCPAILGTVVRRLAADRFDPQPSKRDRGLNDLLLYDGAGECVALFPAGTWTAAWRADLTTGPHPHPDVERPPECAVPGGPSGGAVHRG